MAFIAALVFGKVFFSVGIKGIIGIGIGGTMIFALGLADDIKRLKIMTKLIVQILAAAVLIVCNVKIRFLPWEWLNNAVTMLWVVGVTNSFNLVDIMDGLAAGIALIAAAAFFIIGVQTNMLFSPMAAICLAGATAGFLVYNYPPAVIFMGDAGSLFLGFMLSALAMGDRYTETNVLAVISPLLILGVPVFETFFVMWIRYRDGKKILWGSPDHFPLRLLKIGLSRGRVLAVAYSSGAVLSVLAWTAIRISPSASIAVYTLTALVMLFFAHLLGKIRI